MRTPLLSARLCATFSASSASSGSNGLVPTLGVPCVTAASSCGATSAATPASSARAAMAATAVADPTSLTCSSSAASPWWKWAMRRPAPSGACSASPAAVGGDGGGSSSSTPETANAALCAPRTSHSARYSSHTESSLHCCTTTNSSSNSSSSNRRSSSSSTASGSTRNRHIGSRLLVGSRLFVCRPQHHLASASLSPSSPTPSALTLTAPGTAGTVLWPSAAQAQRHMHAGASGAVCMPAGGGGGDGGGGGEGSCRTPGAPSVPPPAVPGLSGRMAPPREEGLGAPLEVFDRPLKALQRDRSAALLDGTDPLLTAISERLLDRLEDCRRGFPTAVVLGGAALPVVKQLAGGRGGIERLIVVDPSQAMLERLQREEAESRAQPGTKPWPRMMYVRGDEEHLPLAGKSVDLVISCLGLHWANDLPGAMAQCRAALVPDGLFLAALLGGDTLQEMRIACALAQMEREGGVSAVVSPLAQVRDAGNLLTRADLRLPSVDVDSFVIGYPSPLELVQHLRAIGESNASVQRRRMLPRDSALAAAAVYQSMFGDKDGSVSATYQVIFMTGWSPADNQPKAAKRGSATVSFQELADGLVKEGQALGGTADEGYTK